MHGADIHFHLLPGVDDGPADMHDTLALARAGVEDGTRTVVATPHVRTDFVTDVLTLGMLVDEVQRAIDAAGIPLAVRCGGELGHDMVGRLGQEELDSIAVGPQGARWLLVETPFEPLGEDFHAATAELRARGYGVVLAHPERSADAALFDCAGVRRELMAGSLVQVNALSLSGGHGAEAEVASRRLVREGMVALVGSDAMDPRDRPRSGPRAAGCSSSVWSTDSPPGSHRAAPACSWSGASPPLWPRLPEAPPRGHTAFTPC
jgi:protein-tyrosine phosphatase